MSALLKLDETLTIGVNVIVRPGDQPGLPRYDWRVAPQDWVALTGPCPTCDEDYRNMRTGETHRCNGRWIVPLYAECPVCATRLRHWPDADKDYGNQHADCNGLGFVLAGRGSIEVVPVDAAGCDYGQWWVVLNGRRYDVLGNPGPGIVGSHFGILIDCVEVFNAETVSA